MRIAILGGTFDPIHNGHLAAAQSVSSAFRTDEVHFVPAYSAPHKQSHDTTSAFHRFAMVALAIAPFERFRASTIEVDALEKRYTVNTLERMRAENPDRELLFVLGTDMYRDFETWKSYRALFALAHLAVVHRPGFTFREDLAPHRVVREDEQVTLPATPGVFYLPFVEQPISSTAIREACRRGDDAGSAVPAAVRSYIERHKLYS
ncbi:MAG TPA: nicotinate-nucleotide adenylyltransferase [Terriglobia bacterium]|nr:nicotinate-nucleotide adenylyltransferase [Terriglobia bacterium]